MKIETREHGTWAAVYGPVGEIVGFESDDGLISVHEQGDDPDCIEIDSAWEGGHNRVWVPRGVLTALLEVTET